jgi:hypothetical protein
MQTRKQLMFDSSQDSYMPHISITTKGPIKRLTYLDIQTTNTTAKEKEISYNTT